ncbi:MAG: hypothetical protein ACE5F5_11905 [Acidimicrobiia bacterium]
MRYVAKVGPNIRPEGPAGREEPMQTVSIERVLTRMEDGGHNEWEPEWKPLERTVSNPGDYMWMSWVELDDVAGTIVEAYKNTRTRRYLYLSLHRQVLQAWERIDADHFRPMSIQDAVAHAEG